MQKKNIILGGVFFCLIAAVICFQLFVPPITGLANNGDYERVMGYGGLEVSPQNPATQYYAYLNTTYAINAEKFIPFWYVTSQGVFVMAMVGLNWVLGQTLFDIRLMGFLHTLLFLLGIGMILRAIKPLHPLLCVTAGFLLLACCCDAGYIVYFNSFYSEPGAYVFLFLLVGSAMMLILGKPSERATRGLLIAYTLFSALLITAKAQYVFLGIPLAVFGYVLAQKYRATDGKLPRRWRGSDLAAFLIILTGAYYLFGRPQEVVQCNLYHMVFLEILPHSPTPLQDLDALGVDRKFAYLSGTTWFTPGLPMKTPEFQAAFFGHIRYGTVLKFFLTHPARLWQRVTSEAPSVFSLRPQYLGNYAQSSGKPPYAKNWQFSAWSSLRESLPWKNGLLVLFTLINAVAIFVKYRFFDRNTEQRMLTGTHLLLFVMAGMEFAMVLLGDGGGETVKHMHLAAALTDLCLIFLATYLAGLIARRLPWKATLPDNA